MKRVLMNIIVTLSAIVFLANQSFAQTAQTLPYTDDFSTNSGWTYADADDYGRNSWLINEDRLFVRQYNGYYIAAYDTDMCATSYIYRNIQVGSSDSIRIEFDITVGGQKIGNTYYDYAFVLLAPENYNYMGATFCLGPDCLRSPFVIFSPMANLTSVHKDTTIVNYAPNSTLKIVFAWHNERDNNTDVPSAIIDNLSITEVNAPTPTEPESAIDTSKYITLTVLQGDTITFNIKASADNTPIKIESGSWDTIITAGTTDSGYRKYKSQSTTMTIYGDVKYFDGSNNYTKVSAIDASHNTALTFLDCRENYLTSLNVSGLTNLVCLDCYGNLLTSLDISTLNNLEYLDCSRNLLTSLDVSTLNNLKNLYCDKNQLTSLDVSTPNNLKGLSCVENQLTSLNISGRDSLEFIICYDNPLSTQAIDNLYCQLPDRTSQETEGKIVVSLSATDEIVLATNKTNAADKNWVVLWGDTTDYSTYEVVTVGTYVCREEPSALANIEEQTVTLYPNPVKDEIVLKGIKGEMITVFDANGRIVKQEEINEKLDIKDLENGVYYLQVKGVTTKLIKQ